MKRYPQIYVGLIILLILNVVHAQFDYGFDFTKVGSAGLQFLKIGVGARECALGEAGIAISQDANSVFWNTGGLAYVENLEVSFSYNQWLVNSNHDAGVIAYPFKGYVFGLSVISLSIDEFEETTVLEPQGTTRMVNAGDILIGLAVARRFTNKLSIGGQVKFVQEKLDDYTMNNFLFDVGTLYYTGFHQLRLAFTLQHFGPDMKLVDQKFRTPLMFRVAAADDIIDNDKFRLTTAVELVHPTDNDEWVNIGAEFSFRRLVDLRAGYRYNRDEGELTLGAGVRFPDNDWLDLRIDYAYMPFGKLFGDVHRVSMGFGL